VIFSRTVRAMFACVLLTNMPAIASSGDLEKGGTLCANDEDVYFSCEVEGAQKIASVCAARNTSPDDGYVQYRYGTRAKVDFRYPSSLLPPRNRISMIDVSRSALGLGTHLKFKNGDLQYVVSNALVPGEVYVVKNGKIVFEKVCKGADYIPFSNKARDGVQWGSLQAIDGLDNH
jgi:hypothetical protein